MSPYTNKSPLQGDAMGFAWGIHASFLSNSSCSWPKKGRPKIQNSTHTVNPKTIIDRGIAVDRKLMLFSGHTDIMNISNNLSCLYIRKLINESELEVACAYKLIASCALSPLDNMKQSAIANIKMSPGYNNQLYNKTDKAIKKYARMRKLMIAANPRIDSVMQKAIVKEIVDYTSVSGVVLTQDLKLIREGLFILHNYMSKAREKHNLKLLAK
jgi:hypothetical protein